MISGTNMECQTGQKHAPKAYDYFSHRYILAFNSSELLAVWQVICWP